MIYGHLNEDGSVSQMEFDPVILEREFRNPKRLIASTTIGSTLISTVFLVLNHGWFGSPEWFETMVFGGLEDGYQDRYGTYQEALAGHERVCEMVRRVENKNE